MSFRLLPRAHSILFTAVVIAILFAFGIPILRANSQSAGYTDYAGGAKGQIEVMLHADGAPAPGGVANFTFAMKPWLNAPNLTVNWELPDGGELLGGPAEETLGAVAAGTTVTQTRQLRFPNPGIYRVNAHASYQPEAGMTLSAMGVLFFTIDANGSTASDSDPRQVAYAAPSTKPTIDKSGKVVAAGAWETNIPEGCFKVHGFLTREDREGFPTPSPHYVDFGGSAVPVHNMLVEMREEDTFSDDSYGHTITDSNGRFEFNFCDDDGFLNDELELYFRYCSEVWDGHQIGRIIKSEDDGLYCFDSGNIDSEGGDVDFDVTVYKVDTVQAAVANIADSLFWATKFWNNNLNPGVPRMDRSVNVHWDRADKFAGAFYDETTRTITLGDDVSDPDEWDDSVIIHEWGHFADHQFSCNQDPGGPHSYNNTLMGVNATKLAWGEGWGDYLQSAARTIIPGESNTNWYLDINTANVDLEVVANASDRSESGVTTLLWDLFDNANDGSDTVNHGHARIQQVFTDPSFKNNLQCDTKSFIAAWKGLSMPTDAATAATITQNTGIVKPFAAAVAVAAADGAGASPLSVANLQALNAAPPYTYRWWDQVTMVVDNSSSMAAPAGTPKIDAVKTLMKQQVLDGEKNPLGTEFDIYTFNEASADPNTVSEGKFFANQLNPIIDGIQADGAEDGDCLVNSLYALSQAAQDKYDGQAWLYTDGEAYQYTSAAYIQQQLNNRLLRGSVVLLGGCSAPLASTPLKDAHSPSGPEVSYLGVAADGQEPAGIVPYLLTALGTGGNFLYVAPDQLANATDILRAQASHSAGAGSWSDYVSSGYTYRWDRLASWEYSWLTPSPSSRRGQSVPNDLEIANLPPMTVWGQTFTKVQVSDNGSFSMGEPVTPANQVLYGLWPLYNPGLDWYYNVGGPHLAAANDSPDAPNADGYIQDVYAEEVGEWVVLTVTGEDDPTQAYRAYQVLINKNTGEIRYQYQAVAPGDSLGADIGVILYNPFDLDSPDVYASNEQENGATAGMGYKFVSAPPQPSKTYTTVVDSKISGVGFLLTGYSGSLNPMSIVAPNGTPVDCADSANVLCVSIGTSGLIQYVQVNVNGNGGIYTTTVSGEGTFSFQAMAASAIRAKGLGKRTLSLDSQLLQVDFGGASDGCTLNGWLQTTAGARFGSAFALYDDGAHSDGGSCDGVFGSDGFTPPGRGVAYLWVEGTVGGERVVRSDPTPFNFQPLLVTPVQENIDSFVGESIQPMFSVTNQDSVTHCYYWEVEVPTGFKFDDSSGSPFCVAAGDTVYPYANFHYPMSDISGGASAEMNANFFETEKGAIVGGSTVNVRMFRPLAGLEIDNKRQGTNLRPNSTDTVSLTARLLDDQGQVSGYSMGLFYSLESSLGSIDSLGNFEGGRMPLAFTSGDQVGTAVITMEVEGGFVATTTLEIRNPQVSSLDLVASPTDMTAANTSNLVATVRDAWGDPLVGQTVRLSISDDDGRDVNGDINGSSIFTGTTDANGQVSATFTKGEGEEATYYATVTAESLVPQGGGFRVTHEDAEILSFTAQPLPAGQLYLPFTSKADQ